MDACRKYFHGRNGFVSKYKYNKFKNAEKLGQRIADRVLETGTTFTKSSGRRIVDLDVLANDLWCSTCDSALTLKDIVNENLSGLASVFSVKCNTCDIVHEVSTSACQPTEKGGRPLFNVNMKIAMGKIYLIAYYNSYTKYTK
jgi:hypothetical protein